MLSLLRSCLDEIGFVNLVTVEAVDSLLDSGYGVNDLCVRSSSLHSLSKGHVGIICSDLEGFKTRAYAFSGIGRPNPKKLVSVSYPIEDGARHPFIRCSGFDGLVPIKVLPDSMELGSTGIKITLLELDYKKVYFLISGEDSLGMEQEDDECNGE